MPPLYLALGTLLLLGARHVAGAASSVNTTGTVTLSVLQLEVGVPTTSLDGVTAAIRAAKAGGAQLAVLPGGFFTLGPNDSPSVLAHVAEEESIAVVSTGATAEGGRQAVLLGSDGTVLLNRSSTDTGLWSTTDPGATASTNHPQDHQQKLGRRSSTAVEGVNRSYRDPQGDLDCGKDFDVARLPVPGRPGQTVGVGLLLDREWECFHGPRALMLAGADVVIVVGSGPAPGEGAPQMALYTRAWENVLAIVLAQPAGAGGSQAYLGVKDTDSGEGVVVLPPTPQTVKSYAVPIDLDALWANRSTAIWGDSFRRPYNYRSLCGFAPVSSASRGDKLEAVASAATTVDRDHTKTTKTTGEASEAEAGNPSGRLTIMMLQLAPRDSEVHNMAAAVENIKVAAAQGADIVILPELYNVGYCHLAPSNITTPAFAGFYNWTARAQRCDGDGPQGCGPIGAETSPFVARMAALAAELKVAIQAPFLRVAPRGGPPENAVAVIDRFGATRLVYSKVHTAVWSQCEAMTAPGNRHATTVLDTRAGNITVGPMICADREYPESPRMLAEMGAELILVSNACTLTDWHLAMFRTRAYENAVAVAMANYGGVVPLDGRSPAYGAQGETLAVGVPGREEIVTALLNLTELRAYRASAAAVSRRRSRPLPALCDPTKTPGFHHVNPLGRPAHGM